MVYPEYCSVNYYLIYKPGHSDTNSGVCLIYGRQSTVYDVRAW